MSKLETFRQQTSPIQQNRMLFDWLRDDTEREALYEELRREGGYPPLRFKSMLRSGKPGWPDQEVYLLSRKSDIEFALQNCSVKPYGDLDTGARFMLGLDPGRAHDDQRKRARAALCFSRKEIEDCAVAAFRRASILPLKCEKFDLPTEMAEQVALRFIALLFGFRDEAHFFLQEGMRVAYTRLVFQIIGRHFVSESGLPPSDSSVVRDGLKHLKTEIRKAFDHPVKRPDAPQSTVIHRLVSDYGKDPRNEELVVVLLGLVAGAIGNVSAAVSIVIHDIFNAAAVPQCSPPPIEEARKFAQEKNTKNLEGLIWDVLRKKPPAPFLARMLKSTGYERRLVDDRRQLVPEGAYLLLAMGVPQERGMVFGDSMGDPHQCVGEHLAFPLIVKTVQSLLRLPGLTQVIDPASGKAEPLTKRWGAICGSYPLQYQRPRRLNQQALHLVLPIKKPIAENRAKLLMLMQAGAPVVEEALDTHKHVHSAYFMLLEGEDCLRMMTVYDGDFDAYVEHFAIDVPLFDEQLKYLEDAPPLPTSKFPKQFVDWVRRHNHAPFGDYFYSAYPTLTVADIVKASARP